MYVYVCVHTNSTNSPEVVYTVHRKTVLACTFTVSPLTLECVCVHCVYGAPLNPLPPLHLYPYTLHYTSHFSNYCTLQLHSSPTVILSHLGIKLPHLALVYYG